MAQPAAVRVVTQRHGYDCGIAVLAMLLDRPFGDVSAVARRVLPDVKVGMGVRDLQRVARACGVKLRAVRRRQGYLDGASGALGVLPNKRSPLPDHGHWLLYRDGVIIDTDRTVWPVAAEYFKVNRARPVTLLVPEAA